MRVLDHDPAAARKNRPASPGPSGADDRLNEPEHLLDRSGHRVEGSGEPIAIPTLSHPHDHPEERLEALADGTEHTCSISPQ